VPEKARREIRVRIELGGRSERPTAGPPRVGVQFWDSSMESIRPNNSDPIPVQASQHHVGTILIRFVGILVAAIAVMALLWSR
jgi:hypothetical protein